MAKTINGELVNRAVNTLLTGTAVNENEAKTIVYWAIASYGVAKEGGLFLFPILVTHGKPETGKSTMQVVVHALTGASFMSITTPAALRDMLEKHPVVLIEEGDKLSGEKLEELILARYTLQSSMVHKKVRETWGGFEPKDSLVFGATMIHKRYEFENLALASRCIIISTRKDKTRKYEEVTLETIGNWITEEDKDAAEKLWKKARECKGLQVSGRTATNWRSLMMVATTLGDEEWLKYADDKILEANNELDLDEEFELEDILDHVVRNLKGDNEVITKGCLYLSTIIEHLKKHYFLSPSAKKVAKVARNLSYAVSHHRDGFAIVVGVG